MAINNNRYYTADAGSGSRKKTTTTTSSTSTSKKSTGTTTTATPTTTTTGSSYTGGSNYYNASDVYSEYLAQLRAAAQEAYDRNMASLNEYYSSAKGNLDSNLDSTKSLLKSSYNKSANSINADAEGSLREAYVNNMLQKKSLQQALAAQGLNGGASESTLARLSNNYGNSRTDIDTQRNSSLSDLNETYQTNLANAIQAYNSAVNSLDAQKLQYAMQIENALTNFQSNYAGNFASLATSDDSYLDMLSQLASNQAGYTYDATSATNPYTTTNTTQATSNTSSNAYALYQQAQALANSGNTSSAQQLLYSGAQQGLYGVDTLSAMLAQLAS